MNNIDKKEVKKAKEQIESIKLLESFYQSLKICDENFFIAKNTIYKDDFENLSIESPALVFKVEKSEQNIVLMKFLETIQTIKTNYSEKIQQYSINRNKDSIRKIAKSEDELVKLLNNAEVYSDALSLTSSTTLKILSHQDEHESEMYYFNSEYTDFLNWVIENYMILRDEKSKKEYNLQGSTGDILNRFHEKDIMKIYIYFFKYFKKKSLSILS